MNFGAGYAPGESEGRGSMQEAGANCSECGAFVTSSAVMRIHDCARFRERDNPRVVILEEYRRRRRLGLHSIMDTTGNVPEGDAA